MSFDLAVWHETAPITNQEAGTRYEQLCALDTPRTTPSQPRLAAFHAELARRFPDLESLSDEECDRSPWSGSPFTSDYGIVMTIRWASAKRMTDVVAELAERHGLVWFDPQETSVHHPLALRVRGDFELTCCDGSRSDDPGPADIERALRGLGRRNWYAILERSDGWYVQVGLGEAAGTRPGWYALEWRGGSAARHHRTELTDLDRVIAAFTGFASGSDAWKEGLAWRPLNVGPGSGSTT